MRIFIKEGVTYSTNTDDLVTVNNSNIISCKAQQPHLIQLKTIDNIADIVYFSVEAQDFFLFRKLSVHILGIDFQQVKKSDHNQQHGT